MESLAIRPCEILHYGFASVGRLLSQQTLRLRLAMTHTNLSLRSLIRGCGNP
ncbi:hypothetical protein [Helicobacter rodentium]|uniref:hypothetical protein n=1 Tax=Helicobacter rodentium TaxID=59617 RepID=UPI002557D324|nr:hypothetical protein [Helicobacter rodentium]